MSDAAFCSLCGGLLPAGDSPRCPGCGLQTCGPATLRPRVHAAIPDNPGGDGDEFSGCGPSRSPSPPGNQPENSLFAKTEDQIREEMRGFPPAAIGAVIDLREQFDSGGLRKAMLGVLEFYLPKSMARPAADVPDTMRLREDMGVDSLTLAEAAFKFDELLGVAIETRETAELKTVGDIHAFLCSKLGLEDSARDRPF